MIQGYGAGAGVTAAGVFGHNEYCERLIKYELRTWISRFMGMKHIIILGDGMADWPVKSLEKQDFVASS